MDLKSLFKKKKQDGNENEITKAANEAFFDADEKEEEDMYQENELDDDSVDDYDRNARSEKPEKVKKWIVYTVIGLIGFLSMVFIGKGLFTSKDSAFVKPEEETVSSAETAKNSRLSNPASQSPADYQSLRDKEIERQEQGKFTTDKNGRVIPKADATNNEHTGTQQVEGVVIDETVDIEPSNVQARGGSVPMTTSYDEQKANEYITSSLSFFGGGFGKETAASTAKPAENNNAASITRGNQASKTSSGRLLRKTTLIPATLLSGINSDLGGNVMAQVRQDVYDTETGMFLLIPEGSRLIGHFDAGSTTTRIGVIFTEIILPNGVSILLDDNMASDDLGYPGLKDKYSTHRAGTLKNGILTALFAAALQSNTGNSNTGDKQSPGQEAVSGAVANVIDTFNNVLEKGADLPPTITIRPGFTFNVMLNQDITLPPYQRLSDQEF